MLRRLGSRRKRRPPVAARGGGAEGIEEQVGSSQVTFIYIAPLTIQIVTKHCTISK